MIMYYDIDNTPIPDVIEWAKLFENRTVENGRHLGSTKMWFGFVWVSTVWLGMDHDWGFMAEHEPGDVNPMPLQFETMVFIRGHGTLMRRWRCKEQAEAGHAVTVRELRNPITLFKIWREYR